MQALFVDGSQLWFNEITNTCHARTMFTHHLRFSHADFFYWHKFHKSHSNTLWLYTCSPLGPGLVSTSPEMTSSWDMTAITSIMRTLLNTERRRRNNPETREDDKVEVAAACEVKVEQVHATSCVCLEAGPLEEVWVGKSLVDEGRSSVVVGVDEECPWGEMIIRNEKSGDKVTEEGVAVRRRLQLKSPIRARHCSIDIITAYLKQ